MRMTPPTINTDELSQAIQDCQQNHQECRKKTTEMSSEPIEISLIDCRSRKIVQAMSSETYVALSYVWGGVPTTSLETKPLPRTLEHAIEVTLSLGFQYVWIDRFCVNQRDHAIKQEQIRTMGRVYEDAVVTLIAASGSDANHGLPGAPSRPRKTQKRIELDGCIISQMGAPISCEVERSVWGTRGWTFQEQFFSRRFLIFAPEEVSFECGRVQFSTKHGMRYRGGHGLTPSVRKPAAAWPKLFSTLHENNGWLALKDVAERYTYLETQYWFRHLSVEEDGINAFTAVLEILKGLWNEQLQWRPIEGDTINSRMTFTAGMPHLIRHHAESPEPSLDLFVHGLSWFFWCPIKRRKHFPSWCWAGWTPSVSTVSLRAEWHQMKFSRRGPYFKPLVHNVFFRQNYVAGAPAPSGHKTVKPGRIPIAEHELLDVPDAVIFDAPIVQTSAVSWSERNSEPLLWGRSAQWHGCAHILDRGVLLDGIAQGKYCLIVLAIRSKLYGEPVLLLVRRLGQCRYERSSLVLVGAISWHPLRELGDVRTWELI